MKRFIVAVALSLLLLGCEHEEFKVSEIMTEDATVVDLVYSPARHGSDVAPTFSSGGDVGLTIVDVTLEQKYAVVFECKHGKFIVENNQQRAKEMWNRLKVNQKVIVAYQENYRVVTEKGKETKTYLTGYTFLEAR